MRVQSRAGFTLGGMLLIAALAACNTGTVNSTPASPPVTTSASASSSTTAAVALPATVAGGITTNAVLPPASAAAQVTEASSVAAPAGVTPLSVQRLAALSKKTTAGTTAPTVILYVQFTTPINLTFSSSPVLSFTLPSVDPTLSYYISINSANNWTTPFAGPATVTGTTLSFASVAASISIGPAAPLTIGLYSIPTSSIATPTPSPSAVPTPTPTPVPTPTPAPVASPNVLTFDATNPSAQTFTVTETGYSGTFTATIGTCTQGIQATPTPFPYPTASGAPTPTPTTAPFIAQVSPATSSGTFTVTSGNDVGTCPITITDSTNQSTTVTVNTDVSFVQIYSAHRSTR